MVSHKLAFPMFLYHLDKLNTLKGIYTTAGTKNTGFNILMPFNFFFITKDQSCSLLNSWQIPSFLATATAVVADLPELAIRGNRLWGKRQPIYCCPDIFHDVKVFTLANDVPYALFAMIDIR